MTTAGRREARFGDITKVRRMGALFCAMSGSRNTVIIAENFNGLAQVQGETPDLGAEARDITRNFLGGSDVYYILTDDGVQLADATVQVPILGAKINFDPGDGRWILSTYNDAVTPYIVTPVDGGIQVLDQSGVRTSVSTPAGVGGCRDAVIGSDDVLYVVDEVRAKIHVWRIIGPKAVYIDSFRAMNCRDVVKVVLDEDVNVMFVQCKHRIVGFNVTPPYSADSEISVTLRQDYGKLAEDYTDFVKIGTNKYWIGVDADSPLNAGSAFLGRTYAAWDVGNDVLFAAFPDTSLFAASNVIPYVGEDLIPVIPDIIPPPVPPVIPVVPPVIPPPVAPPAPVITSNLATSLIEDTLLSYTITATGAGPIYYDLGARPSWVTSINHTTGVVLGIPPDIGTFNITITATNAGGTDTEILVVTVTDIYAGADGWKGTDAGVLWYSNDSGHWQDPELAYKYTHPAGPSKTFRFTLVPEAGGRTAIGMRAVGPVALTSGGYSTPLIVQVTISTPGTYLIFPYLDLDLNRSNTQTTLGTTTITPTIVGDAAFPSASVPRRGEIRKWQTGYAGASPFSNIPFGAIAVARRMPPGSAPAYYTRLPSGSGGQTYTCTSSGNPPTATGALGGGQSEVGNVYYPSPSGTYSVDMMLIKS